MNIQTITVRCNVQICLCFFFFFFSIPFERLSKRTPQEIFHDPLSIQTNVWRKPMTGASTVVGSAAGVVTGGRRCKRKNISANS